MADLRIPDLNSVSIAGRLTRDPESRHLAGGSNLCEFSIAQTRFYRDKKTEERKEETSFFEVVVWGAAAERVTKTLKKGDACIVEGRLKQERWQSKEGAKRSTTKVQAVRVQPLQWTEKQSAPKQSTATPEEDLF